MDSLKVGLSCCSSSTSSKTVWSWQQSSSITGLWQSGKDSRCFSISQAALCEKKAVDITSPAHKCCVIVIPREDRTTSKASERVSMVRISFKLKSVWLSEDTVSFAKLTKNWLAWFTNFRSRFTRFQDWQDS